MIAKRRRRCRTEIPSRAPRVASVPMSSTPAMMSWTARQISSGAVFTQRPQDAIWPAPKTRAIPCGFGSGGQLEGLYLLSERLCATFWPAVDAGRSDGRERGHSCYIPRWPRRLWPDSDSTAWGLTQGQTTSNAAASPPLNPSSGRSCAAISPTSWNDSPTSPTSKRRLPPRPIRDRVSVPEH
jgi:hypothetical protein